MEFFFSKSTIQRILVLERRGRTVDVYHRPAAVALDFNWPDNMTDFDRWQYENRLHEVPYRMEFLANTHPVDIGEQ